MLAGLSDRLGWEANAGPGARREPCPSWTTSAWTMGDGTTVYDGRLGHDIPTVVVVRDAVALWGAGSTFAAAYHRALFGDHGTVGPTGELDDAAGLLDRRRPRRRRRRPGHAR